MKTLAQLQITLKEGGNAVADVVRINQENSMATVEDVLSEFLPLLKIKKADTAILGSTGKKAPKGSSGDIDMAISSVALLKANNVDTFDDIMDHIISAVKKGGHKFKDMRGIGIVSFAYPITNEDGLQAGEFVQVDFMVMQNVKFAAWAFFSPSYLESEFKGVYRNFLNFNIAKNAKLVVNKIDPETKTPVEWSRYWIDNQKGLAFGTQTNLSPKTGKIVKTLRAIDKKTVSYDPDEIVEFLYGVGVKARDVESFENSLKAVMSNKFPNKSKRNIILKATSETLQHEGYPIPEILSKLIK
jgi:hypothetical protein